MRPDGRISQLERELAEERVKNARLQAELAMLQVKHTSLQTDDAQLCQQMEIEPYGRKDGVIPICKSERKLVLDFQDLKRCMLHMGIHQGTADSIFPAIAVKSQTS